ncbi:formyltetrahydrofolate deformylase [Apiospora marii]|uniref:formyltetrahydrofolate deformylase n=1 Tax=Apiospora marii TaxID=335849 RepID=UPI00312DD17E
MVAARWSCALKPVQQQLISRSLTHPFTTTTTSPISSRLARLTHQLPLRATTAAAGIGRGARSYSSQQQQQYLREKEQQANIRQQKEQLNLSAANQLRANMSSAAVAAAAANPPSDDHILTLSCPDKPGIVHAVTGLLAAQNLNILDLQQFSDRTSESFFMRVHFGHAASTSPLLDEPLKKLAEDFQIRTLDVRPRSAKPRVLIMVSKIGHCLNDLLFRCQRTGQLNVEVPLIVSNHPDFAPLAASYGIAFHHLPVTKDTKLEQEKQILDLIAQHNIDLVVLARYMQVLTPGLCSAMSGRIINIHHSFLPSFKGAKPYHQAYERGVKIIGATAHFVTADLDEGPIIEQRVARVDHALSPKELVDEGSNVESQVLAAAVKWWSEKRVFLNGTKTVVFN